MSVESTVMTGLINTIYMALDHLDKLPREDLIDPLNEVEDHLNAALDILEPEE